MTYDEMAAKLNEIKAEFKKNNGYDMTRVDELEAFLNMRLIRKKSGSLKSLRGLKF